jgi:NitT/TauT family transport system substrate-binding protein
VVNSADIFGALTIIMSYTTKRFYDANPKLSAAFVAAADEAAQFIAANKREAARIYIELAQVKTSEDEMLRMLNDPDTRFSAAPQGAMTYANFMADIGTLKQRPAGWKDLFFPPVHDRPGS